LLVDIWPLANRRQPVRWLKKPTFSWLVSTPVPGAPRGLGNTAVRFARLRAKDHEIVAKGKRLRVLDYEKAVYAELK
jgi:hypothetical protein